MKDIVLQLPPLPSDQAPARAIVTWTHVVFLVSDVPTKAQYEELMLDAALRVLSTRFGYVPTSLRPRCELTPVNQEDFGYEATPPLGKDARYMVDVYVPHISNPVDASRARLAGL